MHRLNNYKVLNQQLGAQLQQNQQVVKLLTNKLQDSVLVIKQLQKKEPTANKNETR